jgi:hypothetical protein
MNATISTEQLHIAVNSNNQIYHRPVVSELHPEYSEGYGRKTEHLPTGKH